MDSQMVTNKNDRRVDAEIVGNDEVARALMVLVFDITLLDKTVERIRIQVDALGKRLGVPAAAEE
jgi:hypothetical protein